MDVAIVLECYWNFRHPKRSSDHASAGLAGVESADVTLEQDRRRRRISLSHSVLSDLTLKRGPPDTDPF